MLAKTFGVRSLSRKFRGAHRLLTVVVRRRFQRESKTTHADTGKHTTHAQVYQSFILRKFLPMVHDFERVIFVDQVPFQTAFLGVFSHLLADGERPSRDERRSFLRVQ
jgi:hypothetical protein